ncbi:MAG: tandem-95 repeat protein [Novosphingobium sp.]|nr:tandem-95 repeat protein [Novosphingobium sp.]
MTTLVDENDPGASVGAPGGTGLSLREAISIANSTAGLDAITFAPALSAGGTITLTGGQLSITDPVTIDNGTTPDITIDAGGASRVFLIDTTSAALKGLTVTGGNVAGPGGGINAVTTELTIRNSVIDGNTSSTNNGGGVHVRDGGTLKVYDSVVSNNTAVADGGGLMAFNATIGIYNTTVSNNTALHGGGVESNGSSFYATSSTISGNNSSSTGGGIDAYNGGTTVLTNTTVANNTAVTDGGGLYSDGIAKLFNATFTGNKANINGGGIHHVGDLEVKNSIVLGNLALGSGNEINNNGGTQSFTAEIVSGNPADVFAAIDGASPSATGGQLANNGGPVQTVALKANAANPALDTSGTGATAADARGEAALYLPGLGNDGANFRDLGAFELVAGVETPSLVVTILTDTVDPLDGETSLREAITYANGLAGADVITFAAALSPGGTITLTGGQLSITDEVTIDGDLDDDGKPDVTLNANGGSGAINVATTAPVVLEGLVVTGSIGVAGIGGAVVDLTVKSSTITGNTGGSIGGGIAVANGALTIVGSTISDNSVTSIGGGVQMTSGTLDIIGSTISGNYAGSVGGGVTLTSGTLTLTNTTIYGNSAGSISGGVELTGGSIYANNVTITGNYAGLVGGGLHTNGALYTSNSLIVGNYAGTDPNAGAPTIVNTASIIGGTAADIFASTVTMHGVDAGVLADNGGPVQTVALKADATNPALDKGDDTVTGFPTNDARGLGRVDLAAVTNNGASFSDLGAFELQQLIVDPVLSGLDGDVVTFTEGDFLRAADDGGDALVTDADSANFDGGTLTVEIVAGGVPAQDQLGVVGGAIVQTTGGNITITAAASGTGFDVVIGTYAGGTNGNPYVITFNAEATPDRVSLVLPLIGYRNASGDNPTPGDRTLEFTITDGDGGSDTATSTVQVVAVNDLPRLDLNGTGPMNPGIDVNAAYVENASATVLAPNARLTDPDSDIASVAVSFTSGFIIGEDELTIGGATSGTSGAISWLFNAATGSMTLTGAASPSEYQAILRQIAFSSISDNPGTARTISFTVSDGIGVSPIALANVAVTPVNDDPVAIGDSVTIAEDTPGVISAATLLANDSDVDLGDTLTIVSVGAATHGSVVLNGGSITFTPASNYNGPASFEYTVSDGNGGTATGTVSINVTPVNDPPVAPATNSVVTDEDTPSAPVAIGASDADGDVLAYSLKPGSEPQIGSVSFAGGSFVYTPFGNFNGGDSFIILIDDGHGGVIEQAVSVTITPVPDAPVAIDDTVAAAGAGLATQIPVATLLANDFDLDGDPLTLIALSNATGGTVSLTGGTVVFTPTPGFVGTGGFDYAISSTDGSASAHVTVTGVVGGSVSPTNQPPTIAPVALVTTLEDIAVQLAVAASDPDGDVLAFAATSGAHGTVTGGSGGLFVYTPAAGYVGTDSFIVSVSDGKGGTASRTVDVTVFDLPDTADWTVHAPDRHVSELGGTGLYMGTAGFQQVTVLDLPGLITFDGSAAITSLARLFIPGGTQTYGPVPGGSPSEVIGTNAAERISLAADANVVLDASFVRDNDTLVILGPSTDYAVASTVAGVILTSAAGAYIRIPAFAADGGVTLEFADVTLQLTTTDGESFAIGSQAIGAAPGLIGSGLASEGLSPGALVYRGGDLIELAGDASDWRIVETGGSALLTDGDTHVLIPLGASGVLLAFDDGARTLALDPHTGTALIGTQVLTEALTGIVAPAQAIALPGTGNPALVAGLELAAGGEVTAGGSFAVMGTSGSEQVTMLHGTFTFDDTFGHGNDTLSFDAATSAFTAVRDSASAVLDSATLDAHIPGGASGTTLAFTNDSRDLVYLSDTDTMTIGTQIITNTAAPLIA